MRIPFVLCNTSRHSMQLFQAIEGRDPSKGASLFKQETTLIQATNSNTCHFRSVKRVNIANLMVDRGESVPMILSYIST